MTRRKVFYEQSNIGRAKYVVNYHDGKKLHADGSPFYDIAIFRNQKLKAAFVQSLRVVGFSERAA